MQKTFNVGSKDAYNVLDDFGFLQDDRYQNMANCKTVEINI